MNWLPCTTMWEYGQSYLSEEGGYRVTTSVAGFGMEFADIMKHGQFLHRTAGHNALNQAKAWCEDHAAGTNMAEEVRLPRTGTETR